MNDSSFAQQLSLYGPAAGGPVPSLPQAERYCRRLARHHYENFSVASLLLPRRLRQHFYNIYAYCRWADDLADELSGAAASLSLLDWWESQLRDCYAGRARHPVMISLATTIHGFEIPMAPFQSLLVAFRQDQRRVSYETFEELMEYCRHSANPVGHLVLYLGRCFNRQNARLADSICTGLQLANFWQDLARDVDRGRVYLPRESRLRFDYDDCMLQQRVYNEAFRRLLGFEVDRAESFLAQGGPLRRHVPAGLRFQVELFIQGGRSVLNSIRKIDFNVWQQRVVVSRPTRLRLLLQAWWSMNGWRA
jgi:squalene synthase HpnC